MKRASALWLLLAFATIALTVRGAEIGKSSTNEVELWSLKPINRPEVPTVANAKWKVRNPIDSFIQAKLAHAKLSPSPEAPRHILIRRLYFDLLGLPPSPEEVAAFERDKSADAYEKLVEKLLASPHYGERWAQHWLDVVRFAESHGFEMNQVRPTAWRYRDYVIDAFNSDKPYDHFIREQFAGDVFGVDAATGFLVAGSWDQVKSPDPVLTASQRADELHDMVSVTGTAFLGLTVGCARCHNHKFDPIPQVDYYALKACLAGVEHGDRKLHTPDLEAREHEIKVSKKRLSDIDDKLGEFEPIAATGRTILIEAESNFGSKTVKLLKPPTQIHFAPGTARGQRDDPGDLEHPANFTRNYLVWSNAAKVDVFSCKPGVDGRFRIQVSWGCRSNVYSPDARFVLGRDGDLTATNDQVEIACVNQSGFADGTANPKGDKLWSGFYDAGAWDLTSSNLIILRGGTNDSPVSAGVLSFTEEPALVSITGSTSGEGRRFLRAPVNARRNVDRFAPIQARFVRFTITRTTGPEPCLDELEVYAAKTNIALASEGTVAAASSVFPNSNIHRLEHLNDGKYGNSRSWISNERGKGWVQLEFKDAQTIDRVVWGRDREQQFSDRLATEYRIEAGLETNDLHLVSSSQDRVPYSGGKTSLVEVSLGSLAGAEGNAVRKLLTEKTELEARLKVLNDFPMVYAGVMNKKPDPVARLQRGDPMQKREVVDPGVLSAVPVRFELGSESESAAAGESASSKRPADRLKMNAEQRRRLALANWIANPANPLPARVMVNRIWQHHFGEGLVSTPSDFGKKGSLPSIPELLDWLASEFIHPSVRSADGQPPQPWSIKHLHRLIVTSAGYRQSSDARKDCHAVDASARMLWRFPPQRLEAEALRDTILSVSGKLGFQAGGPGFSAFKTNDNYVRIYNPKEVFGPPEWRRMIYMTKVRMQQDSTFGAFDCPDGGQIAPKRMRSTTPLQALNLMNSSFMMQQAELLGERLKAEAGDRVPAQVRLAFELVYSREPASQEATASRKLIAAYGLPIFCRALLNSNEFVFVE